MRLPAETARERALRLLELDPEISARAPRTSLLRFSRNLAWRQSLGRWTEVARRWRDRPGKELARGRLLLRLGLPDVAVAPLERAARSGGRRALEFHGEALAASGRPDLALEPLGRALAADPESFWARLWRAECLRRLGRLRAANKDLAKSRRQRPRSPWPLLTSGRADRPGDLDIAVDLAPREPWARLLRGWRFLERGRAKSASADFDAGLARAPFCRWARILRARARLELGDLAGSRSDLEAALLMGPDLGSARRAWKAGDAPDRETRALDRAIARRPGEGWLRAWRGQLLFDSLRPEPALENLRRAVALDPTCGWARAFLARAQALWSDDAAHSEGEMTRAFADSPGCGWILSWRGLLRGRRGDSAGAGRDYAAAVGLHPDYALARGWLAERRRVSGDWRGAMSEYDAACELDPQYGFHFERRRRALWRRGRIAAAFEDMETAVRRESRFRWAAGRSPRDLARAEAELSEVLTRDPADVWARAWRGETRLQAMNWTGAAADLDAAIAARPDAPWPRAWRAEVSLASGQPEAALAQADAALAGDPAYARAWGARARAAAALGRRAAALAAFNQVVARDFGAAWAYVERAKLLISMGRGRAAARDLRQAQALDPGNLLIPELRVQARAAGGRT